MARRNAREMVAFRARSRADAAMARIGMTTASMRGGGDAANVVALKIVQNSRNLARANISEAVARRALTTDVVSRRLAGLAAQRIATSTGLPMPIARMVASPGRTAVRGLLIGGALAGATYLMTRGARAETPTASGENMVRDAWRRVNMPDVIRLHPNQSAAGWYDRVTQLSDNPSTAAAENAALRVQNHYQAAIGAIGNVMARRAEIRAASPSPGRQSIGIDLSGTTALAAGATLGAGYAGYRMLTRGGGVAPPLPAAAVAPVSGLRRVGGLLRRVALPLTALATLNEASRGFTANGPAGALRGAASGFTGGLSEMAIGALPARPATANSDAHAAAVSGAQVAGANASAAIAQLAQGSSTGSPGVAVSSDGQTAGYDRNRRLASGITIHETVSGYATPVRR